MKRGAELGALLFLFGNADIQSKEPYTTSFFALSVIRLRILGVLFPVFLLDAGFDQVHYHFHHDGLRGFFI